jgi:hypothetical protein
MRRVIRKKTSAQILGAVLLVAGLVALFFVFWKASSAISSDAGMSALWSFILNEQVDMVPLVTLKMIYIVIMGIVFSAFGLITLIFSRQIFYLSGESVMLTCPYCRNRWKARRAMGWAECPHCRKFIQPQVLKVAA